MSLRELSDYKVGSPGLPITRRKLLVIDDDAVSRELVQGIFFQTVDVISASNALSGLALAQAEKPDLILMDLWMPEIDGVETCRRLRDDHRTCHIPVLMLTGASAIQERVSAFDMGADDFILKPVQPAELRARVFSKLRRIEERTPSGDVVVCGNLMLMLQGQEALLDGRAIDIGSIEFQVLRYLVENRLQVLDRASILREVWKGTIVSGRTIDQYIKNLRRLLVSFDHEIITIYGTGYMVRERRA